jgi:hypothetical protein
VNVSKVRFFKRCNVQKRTPDPCQFPPFVESAFLLGGSFMQSLRPSLASAEGISSYERARNQIAAKCRQQAGNKRATSGQVSVFLDPFLETKLVVAPLAAEIRKWERRDVCNMPWRTEAAS